MNSITQLRKMVAAAGGELEEDDGFRDMRVIQLCAPDGKLWACANVQCFRLNWATGRTPHAIANNEAVMREAREILARGLRDLAPDEYEIYDYTPASA